MAFLDELTTGLDPHARRAMWDRVRTIRERGTTVFLTIHFMEKAERLCDRVAIIDHDKIVALDTPQNLIDSLGAENRVVFEVDAHLDKESLRAVPAVVRIERIGERVGTVVYGVRFEGNLFSLLAGISLGAFAFFSLGYALVGLVSSARAVVLIGNVVVYPMTILSGATVPLEVMPEAVRTVSRFAPLTHLVALLRGLWFGEGWGDFLTEVAVLAGIGIVGTLVVSRTFRWE